MKQVWTVTSGEYSDYSVLLVFTTEDLARAYIASERPRHDDVNESPTPFILWDVLPGPDSVRWYARVVFSNHQIIVERSEWSTEYAADPTQAIDFDDELRWGDMIQFTAVRNTKDAAVQRVGEWVSEQIAVERTRLGLSNRSNRSMFLSEDER